MEKERQEALEWFVQFANMNLTELKPGDKAKLLVESNEFLFPTKELDKIQISPKYLIPPGTPDDMVKIIRAQIKTITGDMAWAFEGLPKIDSEEYWAKIVELQRWVKANLGGLSETHRPSEAIISMRVDTLIQIYYGDKLEVFNFPITKSQEHYVQLKLYKLLDGLPRSTIQICLGCRKYFLNTTLRKKRFCSPRCMWKVNAEKRREGLKKQPKKYKAYLKKQREIMSRRYEEKRKAELGPNVKVRRRKEG